MLDFIVHGLIPIAILTFTFVSLVHSRKYKEKDIQQNYLMLSSTT